MFKNCTNFINIENDEPIYIEQKSYDALHYTSMFEGCSVLKEIDCSHFTVNSDCITDNMFKGCNNLINIHVGGGTGATD